MKSKIHFLISVFLLTNMYVFAQNYSIVNRFSVTGDGGWDYIASDDLTNRLFVSHGGITQVVDSNTGELLGTIPNTKGVHGIAIDQEEQKAFISCGRDTSVSIIDLSSYELLAKVKVTGVNPDAILYDKFSHQVFVFNGRTANVTVIDARSESVVTTIALSGKPEFAVTDGKGKVYVNIEDKNLIAVIDAKGNSVLNEWSLAPGDGPSGLALDNLTHRLFSVCGNKNMMIMDAVSGRVIDSIVIGNGTDGCVFDPVSKRAYSSNGDGTMTVVQEAKGDIFHVLTSVETHKGARTMCINAKTHHVFLPYAEYGEPPAPTKENPKPRPPVKPGSFTILDIAPN